MKYRSEIDGLRALAVVPVILFHAGLELFSGGFVGVDVFFVISGYLITTILIEDIEKKRFSLVDFYERRARRILPALFFVIFACFPFAWAWMLPSQMVDFSESLIAVSLFGSNFLFWKESGYFDLAAEEKPLLHTWSLAVEEQYYLLFPLMLFFCWRYGRNTVFWLIVFLSAASLALAEWGTKNLDSANFYLIPTRAWELFAGSIAAFIIQKHGIRSNNFLAIAGLAAILYATFTFDEMTPFPSVYGLVPVLGTVLLILFADKSTLAAKVLSNRVFVGIGLISYSAYLWHQPLFAFARVKLVDVPDTSLMLVLSGVAILLAYMSWKYVEQPFRNKAKFSRKSIFKLSAIAMAVTITVGVLGKEMEGFFKYRFSAEQIRVFDEDILRSGKFEALGKSDVSPTWMLLGDSHAAALQESFGLVLSNYGLSSAVYTASACPPALNLWRHHKSKRSIERCANNNANALKAVESGEIKNILISSRFALFMDGDWFDNKLGGVEIGSTPRVVYDHVDFKDSIRPDEEREPLIESMVVEYISSLSESGANIYIIDSIPEVGWHVPELALQNIGTDVEVMTDFKVYQQRIKVADSLFKSLKKIPNVTILESSEVFCDEQNCYATKNGIPLYFDDDHLSNDGARMLLEHFSSVLFDNDIPLKSPH